MVNRRRDLLRLRVELKDILPPIWREILVPARYSFWDLHVAIQDAMDWWDYHLQLSLEYTFWRGCAINPRYRPGILRLVLAVRLRFPALAGVLRHSPRLER
ncbi:MAG: hypothetical protein WA970_13585 [Gammaproteobacteria bacterium]